MNIAVVRVADVIAQSILGQAAEAKLKVKADEITAQTQAEGRAAALAEAEARKQARSPAGALKQSQAQALKRQAEHVHREGEIAVNELRKHLLDDALGKLHPILSSLADEHGVELVLTAPNPSLAYFSPKIDLTDELLTRFNNAFPGETS